ncbi:lipoprotein-releasing system permease protein [Sphingobacterium alimentarium]|uniref:Lipoprotein-releasing system permease protein n=1 Tax=Sphingobacterium alimentarium TaxID=797292 RepID=A0A4V2VUG2_9SPHI|nr:FtsX-like permease family protein [Sphingobacterium alimentarium]TCV18949.1 lipoprotein-releasing system permease protein [Sphingobacterium alimentarium]
MKKIRVPLFFALRYLFSKKSVNAINIISIISIVGIFVSTAALVIVLSFYNGMENFILSMNSKFSPDIRIEATKGKTFFPENPIFQQLAADPAVKNYSETLEDKALIQFEGKQIVGMIKGITPESLQKQSKDHILHIGKFAIQTDSIPYALIGPQIQTNLQVPISEFSNMVELYFPRKEAAVNNINPLEDFNIRSISVNGILTFEPEFQNLVLVPIDFARDIFGEDKSISAIELYLHESKDVYKLQKEIQKGLGEDFQVRNREEQNPILYKTIKSEKWIVFFILTFIGIIAIFNIIGSLTMLVIDKKEDMKILQHIGANKSTIENIFFYEGIMIALIGSSIGIVVGYIFCFLQDTYGFIRTNNVDGNFIDVYPVDMRTQDFILVFVTISVLSIVVSYFSSKLSVKEIGNINTLTSE